MIMQELIVASTWLILFLIILAFDHRDSNGEEMKIWNSKNKLTATDDLVNFVLMKLYEDPDAWHGEKNYLNYKGSNTWVGHKKDTLGEIFKSSTQISISRRQREKLKLAVKNLAAAQALRSIMKATVKNVT